MNLLEANDYYMNKNDDQVNSEIEAMIEKYGEV
jgi:hypothetical protein